MVLVTFMAGCTGPSKKKHTPIANHSSYPTAPSAEQTLEVQLAFARTLERQGDLDQSENAYRDVLNRYPDQDIAIHRLAVIADQRQRYKESAELFQQALQRQPENPDLFCDIGYSFYLQHLWTEAEVNYRHAVSLHAHHERAHNHLGMLLAQTDREKEAIAEFRLAGCSETESHLNLALALTNCKKIAAAREQFQHAQYVSPGSKQVEEKITRMEELLAQADPENASVPSIAQQAIRRHR